MLIMTSIQDVLQTINNQREWSPKSAHSFVSHILENFSTQLGAQYLLLFLALRIQSLSVNVPPTLFAKAFAKLIVGSKLQLLHYFALNDLLCEVCHAANQFPVSITLPLFPDNTHSNVQQDISISSWHDILLVFRISIFAWRDVTDYLKRRKDSVFVDSISGWKQERVPWYIRVLDVMTFPNDCYFAIIDICNNLAYDMSMNYLSKLLTIFQGHFCGCLEGKNSNDCGQFFLALKTLVTYIAAQNDMSKTAMCTQVVAHILDDISKRLKETQGFSFDFVSSFTDNSISKSSVSTDSISSVYYGFLEIFCDVCSRIRPFSQPYQYSISRVLSWIIDFSSLQLVTEGIIINQLTCSDFMSSLKHFLFAESSCDKQQLLHIRFSSEEKGPKESQTGEDVDLRRLYRSDSIDIQRRIIVNPNGGNMMSESTFIRDLEILQKDLSLSDTFSLKSVSTALFFIINLQQLIMAGLCNETHPIYQLAINYLRRRSTLPVPQSVTSTKRNKDLSFSLLQWEYISWAVIYLNEKMLSTWSISPIEYFQRLPTWILFLRSAYACVQTHAALILKDSNNHINEVAIGNDTIDSSTIASIIVGRRNIFSYRLRVAWLSMLVYVKFISLYPSLENNSSEINLHEWIEMTSEMHAASLLSLLQTHLFFTYSLREIRRNGMKKFPVSVLVCITSVVEECNSHAIDYAQHQANDTLLLSILTAIRDIFDTVVGEFILAMEAALSSHALPHISLVAYKVDTSHYCLSSSTQISTAMKLLILCEIHREQVSKDLKMIWLRPWCDLFSQLSSFVDVILRQSLQRSPSATAVPTAASSTVTSTSITSSHVEDKQKKLFVFVSTIISMTTISSILQYINRPIATRLQQHLGHQMTDIWMGLITNYLTEKDVNVSLSDHQQLVYYQTVKILHGMLPYAQEKSNRKLRRTEVTRLQTASQELPSIRSTNNTVNCAVIRAYFAACMITSDVFPETSLVLFAKLWCSWVEYSVVGGESDDDTIMHFLESSLIIGRVYYQERVTEKFPEEVLEVVLIPILDALPPNLTPLHHKLWSMILQTFRLRDNALYMDIYGGYLCSRLAFFPEMRQEKFLRLCPSLKRHVMNMPTSSTTLIHAFPNMLYYLLMSDEIGGMSLKALLTGDALIRAVEVVASILDVSSGMLTKDDLDDTVSINAVTWVLPDSIFDHNMSLLVWTFGCEMDDNVRHRALQAMKVLCMVRKLNAWQFIPETTTKKKSANINFDQDAEDTFITMISKQFLHVVARLLQHNWMNQCVAHQEHGLRCLNGVLDYLAIDETIKYLPKVVIILDSAISSASARLRYEAVKLTQLLCRKLPYEILKQNIPTLLFGLFPIVEGKIPRPSNSLSVTGNYNQSRVEISPTFRRNEESNTVIVSLLTLFCPLENDFFGESMSHKLHSPGHSLQEAEFREQSRLMALEILKMIFVTNREMYQSEFHASPYIPDVPELQTLRQVHVQDTNNMSLHQRVTLLMTLIRHENPNVRLLSLQKIRELIALKRVDIYQILSSSSFNASGSGNDHIVATLLKELLMLTGTETVSWVKEECARCLGEIGCIDPSFVRVRIGNYHKEKMEKDQQVYPWHITIQEFALYMLTEYMVPGLKSAQGSGAQDRCGLAIQELLQVLLQQYAHSLGVGRGIHQTPVSIVTAALQKRGIFDIVEPFLTSKYFMESKIVPPVPPMYQAGMHCKRWVFLFCRYLVSLSTGPYKPIFEACQAVLRHQTELGQFLLPYLILDVVLQNNTEKFNVIVKELAVILGDAEHQQTSETTASEATTESCSINRTGASASATVWTVEADSCVQTVFSLLDTFFSWEKYHRKSCSSTTSVNSNSANAKSSSSAAAVSEARSIDKFNYFGSLECVSAASHKILAALPLTLLSQAALATKAYARALRYLEQDVRQRALQNNITSSSTSTHDPTISTAEGKKTMVIPVRKQTGFKLPTLTADDVDSLAGIYSLLEDPDALQGVQVLRRSYGHPETIIHRVLELELNDDWLGALLEYELLQNSMIYQGSLKLLSPVNGTYHSQNNRRSILSSNGSSGKKKPILRMDSIAVMTRRRSVNVNNNSAINNFARNNQVIDIAGNDDLKMDFDDIVEIERGKLRCLIELGHLESAIYHAEGKSGLNDSLQRTLLSLGTEAAWRLNKWDSLDEFLSIADQKSSTHNKTIPQGTVSGSSKSMLHMMSEADSYQFRLGKALSCLRVRDQGHFQSELLQARLQTMSTLAAASMESYGRAYPMLVRLQTLTELEMGRDLLQICTKSTLQSQPQSNITLHESNHVNDNSSSSTSFTSAEEYLNKQRWQDRLHFLPESMLQKSHLMAVRRAVLGLCGLHKEIAQNWLDMSKLYAQMGRFDSARNALKNAEQYGIDRELVLLEECKILREQGQVQRALILLEPNPVDTNLIMSHLKIRRKADIPGYMDTEEKRIRLAQRLHLATQFLVEAKQSQAASILERYRTTVALHKSNGQVFFDYGKYYEFLYNEHATKEQADENGINANNLNSSNITTTGRSAPSPNDAKLSHHYLEKTIEKYGNCLMLADENLSIQVLPRLLTLWLTFTSLEDVGASPLQESHAQAATGVGRRATSSSAFVASMNATGAVHVTPLGLAQQKVNETMEYLVAQIPSRIWFHGMQQIVSRVLHRNNDTVRILIMMITKVVVSFPKQGVWHIANLVHSLNNQRKSVARQILQEAQSQLCITPNNEDIQMLVDCMKLFQSLIQLAEHQTKEKKLRWSVDARLKLTSFLVPTQTVLMQSVSAVQVAATQAPRNGNHTNNSSSSTMSGMMYIQKFNDTVDVASSKAKPKTITLETTCGKTIKFLCKQEKDGDLRKDARLMEFNTTVNRLLQNDAQGRKRKLRLRTYAVVCLNEECGVLEWVDHTSCFRHVVNDAHAVAPDLYPNISYKDIYHQYLEYQEKLSDDVSGMADAYEALIAASGYRPCFHLWFLDKFSDPMEWLEARTMFARSVAVWSGVGHIIGLGDRHTENILIDTTSGECVHVDFDCLFDKGLTLLKPEIIPFRLTPNLIDAMGVTGVEGCYRKSLEVCLTVLRDNRDTLLSVLEPFLRDPTVAWGRLGRAQRTSDSSNASKGNITAGLDHENKEAREMLQKISNRLMGIYSMVHPHRDKLLRGASKRGQPMPTKGVGSSKEDFLPLSVTGQTQRLIDEATCTENIAQLYIGWQPWI